MVSKSVKGRLNIEQQITHYINSQPVPKRSDMQTLHNMIQQLMPGCKLWFLDGKNAEGKTVSNPNVGYGSQTMQYADGSSREFYQVGLTANTTGISVYIMGIQDKTFLSRTFREKLGKATISGYCIRFRRLVEINLDILKTSIQHGVSEQS